MGSWPYSDDRLRTIYREGRADPTARRLSRWWAGVFALGLLPKRWVTLEVAGRRSGRLVRFPLGMADSGGRWYLVAMLGERCNWVRNVRAAGGRATLRRRRAVAVRLVELPVRERPPIIKRYLEKVPGARPHAGSGSVAGFRVRESALGLSNDTVGRTSTVTGALVITVDQVTRATFRIDLATVRVGGKAQPQFASSLHTREHPDATFTLEHPVTLSSGFASGATVTATAADYLAMNGTSHRVTVTVSGRRDGAALQVAGSIPITFSDWRIKEPRNFGFLASLADHGVAEFLVVLRR